MKMNRRRSRLKTGFIVIFLIVGNAWLVTRWIWPSSVTDVPEVLANLYAKEFCTCHFVGGYSPERCLENHEVLYPPSSVEWNEKDRAVVVRVLWWTSAARAVSERYGCARI